MSLDKTSGRPPTVDECRALLGTIAYDMDDYEVLWTYKQYDSLAGLTLDLFLRDYKKRSSSSHA